MITHGHYTHGKSSPTYNTWQSMRNRCNNPNAHDYKNYGGRGIKVCKEWDSFPKFLSDMGERPKGTTLDRIDVNGAYCKKNCRWATPKMQALNMRTTCLLEYQGEVDSIHGWSQRLGVTEPTVKYNYEHGLPLDYRRRPLRDEKFNGKSTKEWAVELGVKYFTFRRYLKLHGIEAAVEFYKKRGAL